MKTGSAAGTLLFAAALAATVVWLGTRDLESYEHAFFSLDRGTAARAIEVFGQPVYTLSIGLGVRLPLQGSFGSSPAAPAAAFVPAPVAYWLVLLFSVASTLLVVRRALEPLCGRVITWCAAILLFWSVPMATYTVLNDWPEVTVTYAAIVASAFAPHALAEILAAHSGRTRLIGALSLAGIAWGTVALSHPGYWPLIAATLVTGGVLLLVRTDHGVRTKGTALALLAVATCLPVLAQAPDILRELDVPGAAARSIPRYTESPAGSLIAANLFPFGQVGPRLPFSHLLLAIVSLAIALTLADANRRRMAVAAAVLSVVLGIGAVALPAGSSAYSPTSIGTLRDSAAVLAILAAAVTAAGFQSAFRARSALAMAALAVVAVQGPAYAVWLTYPSTGTSAASTKWPGQGVWTRDLTPPAERLRLRGMPAVAPPDVSRVALWPEVRGWMRGERLASTDFADGGFALVTAWTKQRTMRHVMRPNELLFNQTLDLPDSVLCDTAAAGFLQLEYLVAPRGTSCEGWAPLEGVRIDDRFDLFVSAGDDDRRIRTVPVETASGEVGVRPALSADSVLMRALQPVEGTAVTIGPRDVVIRLDAGNVAPPPLLLLPIAFDPAWRTSQGTLEALGGLLALRGANSGRITLTFVPDAVAWLRAISMTLAQVVALLGCAGLLVIDRISDSSARQSR